jgi:hypothetical protein
MSKHESVPFEDHVAMHEYAVAHDMAYAWEGTAEFEKRSRGLRPEQYQVLPVATRRGITNVLLFSKDVVRAEVEADRPRQDALAAKRMRWRASRGWPGY